MAGITQVTYEVILEDEGIVMRLCERTVNGEKVSQSASPYFLNRTTKVAHL
jgi:hypothetical protein